MTSESREPRIQEMKTLRKRTVFVLRLAEAVEEEANYKVDQQESRNGQITFFWSHHEKNQPNDEPERVKDWQREKHNSAWSMKFRNKNNKSNDDSFPPVRKRKKKAVKFYHHYTNLLMPNDRNFPNYKKANVCIKTVQKANKNTDIMERVLRRQKQGCSPIDQGNTVKSEYKRLWSE